MSKASLLSILHISDFHYSKRKEREQKIVVDALISDLESLCIGHRKPDLVVFTGDLVQAAGSDRHDEAYDFLLSRVTKATGCSDERLFIVPGNHDLARTTVSETLNEHNSWRTASNDMDKINSLYLEGAFKDIGARKFGAFNDLAQYLSKCSFQNDFVSIYKIDAINLELVVINTAMLSAGGLENLGQDEGKLAVPEYALLEAADQLRKDTYKIYCTHHPFEMLSEAGSRLLRRSIEQHANIHLFGHMHDPEARNTVSFKGELFSDQAGAVFTRRKQAYIGYSLISAETHSSNIETHLRTYFDDRKSFDTAIDVIAEGKFYSSDASKRFWRTIAQPVDEQKFREYLRNSALEALLAEQETTDGDTEAFDKFVSPPMKRMDSIPSATDNGTNFKETKISFDQLLEEDGNVILYAAAEYGRTTVLKQLIYKYLASAESVRFPRLPIMIDFSDIKQNSDNMLRAVRGRSVAQPDGITVDSLLQLGHVCILIDDVAFSDANRMNILRSFVARFPKVKYVFSSAKSSAAPYGANVNPEMPVNFGFVELCVLTRRDMRQLVSKYSVGGDIENVLDRLQSEFQEINIPFTAANGTILMSIYEDRRGFTPINRSVLMEQFIDTTLRKTAIEQSRRETFDYANKTALLAHIAAWMADQNEYTPETEDVRMVIKGYLDALGLNAAIEELMSEFFAAKIFVKKADSKLSFRYRAILEYFIALQMTNNAKFKDWVMDESRYLQFVNEIQYYAGKLRNDSALVDEIGNRFASLIEEIEREGRPFDLSAISELKLPRKDNQISDSLMEDYLERPLTQEERDTELEAELPTDNEGRQEVFRPNIHDSGQRLVVALVLYSGVVKNMELIGDALKRQHLNSLFRGWSIFWLLSLMVVPEIARHRRFRVNGVLYDLNAPFGMPDGELARAIALNVPSAILQIMSSTLGTEKLERQLTEPTLETTGLPLSFEFLRAGMVADLKLPSTPAAIKLGLEQLRSSPYLVESLAWKIAQLRRMSRISDRHMDEIAAPLAGVLSQLRGGSKNERQQEKSRQLTQMRKEKLVLSIKRKDEDGLDV